MISRAYYATLGSLSTSFKETPGLQKDLSVQIKDQRLFV